MKLQLVSLLLLFVSTILIQIADYRIDEYKSSLLQREIEVSNLYQKFTAEKINSEFAIFKQFVPYEKLSQENRDKIRNTLISNFDSQLNKDPKVAESVAKLKSGSISIKQYFSDLVTIHTQRTLNILNKYNKEVLKINKKIKKGTPWDFWKKFVFIPLQIICLLILAAGYFNLMKDILNRIKKN